MKNKVLASVLFIFLNISVQYAQTVKFLQVDLSAGASQPVLKYGETHMFAGRGMSFSGGFDYFFNKIGVGFSAGTFSNVSQKLFSDYVSKKYFENVTISDAENWNTKYILAGPTFKLGIKRFEWDVYAKGGLSQINIPQLVFAKTFFNQNYQIYHFSGTSENYQFAWNAGTRFTFKMNQWLGLQAKAEYFSTSYMSKFNYDYSYRNAQDGNRNGIIEDSEYFEAQKISHTGTSDINVVNVHMGLIFQLGKPARAKITKMMPDEVIEVIAPGSDEKLIAGKISNTEQAEPVKTEPILEKSEPEVVKSEQGILKSEPVNAPIQSVPKDNKAVNIDEIPVINAHEAPVEPIEIPSTTYEAPEAKYDAEAAEFLYKAGESYFASNDFENALPCFNKLKADPKYPRAKYMFALSLCSMGNCTEAKKEYKDFAKNYKEIDSRTLEIIFASHLERCSTAGKLKNLKNKEKSITDKPQTDNDLQKAENVSEYRIQFIAMKKPNATFPKLVEVGDISTEFFPNMSVYRYTLTGYKDINIAAADVYKVRKLGFRDAFVAVYENGIRVNTLYHSK
jgi:TolA-binding protein